MNPWKTATCTLMAALALAGCTTLTNRRPDWLVNPKAVYPEKTYLVAVGEGDTRRAAENAAAANLSRIFEAHIESDERLTDRIAESGKDYQQSSAYSADINILSSQTLFNIQHAEGWQDPDGRMHAVAYLHRHDTAAIYREKIDALTERVQFLMEAAEQTDNPLKRFAALRSAARQATERALLLQQLRVIHPASASASASPQPLNAIRQALADTAQQIQIGIQIEDDLNQRLTRSLEELITGYGFVSGKSDELSITGRLTLSPAERRNGDLVFVNYALSLQFRDTTGATLISISEKGSEGHFSAEEARRRAVRTLEKAIQAKARAQLDRYFDSLTDSEGAHSSAPPLK